MTEILTNPELIATAQALKSAQKEFDATYAKLHRTLEPLPRKRFWQLLEYFKQNIEQFCTFYKRSSGIEDAAWEFFRLTLVGSAKYTDEEAHRFALTYRKVKSDIYDSIKHLFDYYGDTLEDLADSLPLAGTQFYTEITLSGNIRTLDELYKRIKQLPNSGTDWATLIKGENYVCSSLYDAAKKAALLSE